ncbi:flavodoxin [Desulfohalovibrio reitneri]|uniref:flavodoxin n=1 Tax=Desulfohalovibrio reitneri TaxID=1307759 RepID=UPI0004A73470|nr:flavodoxin [Desulfohalovibrio reitneri]
MARALIVFGSETGNTRKASQIIAEAIEAKGHEVRMEDVQRVDTSILDEPYDLYLLGVSTWGAIDEEVTEDFKDFHEELASKDLSGKPMGVFGCGDSGYDQFCKAVDFVADRVEKQGAKLVLDKLKIDLDPANSREQVEAWAAQAAAAM